jgi:hypothetical protein
MATKSKRSSSKRDTVKAPKATFYAKRTAVGLRGSGRPSGIAVLKGPDKEEALLTHAPS